MYSNINNYIYKYIIILFITSSFKVANNALNLCLRSSHKKISFPYISFYLKLTLKHKCLRLYP